MVRRKYGGAADLSSPEVQAQLQLMVDAATEMAGGVKRSAYEGKESEPELAVGSPGAEPARKRGRILKEGLTTLLTKIESDTNATTDAAEQAVLYGLSTAYSVGKSVGRYSFPTVTGSLLLHPTALGYVMDLARFVARNIPNPSWTQIVSAYGSTMYSAGEATLSAASFATSPQGVLLIGGILLSTAAKGKGQTIPAYLMDVGQATGAAALAKATGVAEDIKTELTRVSNISPAETLNAEIKARLDQKDTRRAIAESLNRFTEKRLAERQATPTVPFAPGPPVTYESVTGPAMAQVRGSYDAITNIPPKKGGRRKTKKRGSKKGRNTRRR